MTRAQALAAAHLAASRVMCPTCSAPPGGQCERRDSGSTMASHHRARTAAGGGVAPSAAVAGKPAGRRSYLGPAPKPASTNYLGPQPAAGAASPRRQLDVHISERRSSDVTVKISARAAEAIEHHAARRGFFTEEYGVLIARPSRNGEVSVLEASGPGKDSQRTASMCIRDPSHDLTFLSDLRKYLGANDLEETGFWHTHLEGPLTPSPADLQHFALHRALLGGDPQWLHVYVGLILGPLPRGGLAARAWATTEGGRISGDPWYRCAPAEIVLEGSQSWSS